MSDYAYSKNPVSISTYGISRPLKEVSQLPGHPSGSPRHL